MWPGEPSLGAVWPCTDWAGRPPSWTAGRGEPGLLESSAPADGNWPFSGVLGGNRARWQAQGLCALGWLCLPRCGGWVRKNFIPGKLQSHTVWSAASLARAAAPALSSAAAVGQGGGGGGRRAGASGGPPGTQRDTSLLSPLRVLPWVPLLLPVSHPRGPTLCPHTPSAFALGWCPSAPRHCPVCSWPYGLAKSPQLSIPSVDSPPPSMHPFYRH